METKTLVLNNNNLTIEEDTIEVLEFSSSLSLSTEQASERISIKTVTGAKGKQYHEFNFALKEGEKFIASEGIKNKFNEYRANTNAPILAHRQDLEKEFDFAMKLNISVARKQGAAVQIQNLVLGLSGEYWYITGAGMEGKVYDKFIFEVEYATQFCVFPFNEGGYPRHPGYNCLPGGGIAAFATAGIQRTGKNEFELQAISIDEVFNSSF